MEKTPNSNAPTLKLVSGPAGRDNLEYWNDPQMTAISGEPYPPGGYIF
jgi:hypothetical protein